MIYELFVNSNISCNPIPQNSNIQNNEPDVPIPQTVKSYLPKNLNLKRGAKT